MFTLNCNGKLLVTARPLIMGIINVTPDSFFEGSRKPNTGDALASASAMLAAGAPILDIGGQSTRPGSKRVGPEEEMDRVLPVVDAIHKNFPEAIISIDTYSASVAKHAVNAGASIINDISGGTMDENMFAEAGKLNVPYICSHIKGTPEDMQSHAFYKDVMDELLEYFAEKAERCLKSGIKDFIIDPGFGFGKTAEHNLIVLKNLSLLSVLNKPILAGLSRKSVIYKTLGITPGEALNGSTVLHTIALLNGACILRVHDVKEAVEAVALVSRYRAVATGS